MEKYFFYSVNRGLYNFLKNLKRTSMRSGKIIWNDFIMNVRIINKRIIGIVTISKICIVINFTNFLTRYIRNKFNDLEIEMLLADEYESVY